MSPPGLIAVSRGVISQRGFVAAGATQAVSPQVDLIDAQNVGFSVSRTIAAATLGGTVSSITGGKFANGAITAAFSRAFNDEISVHNAPRRAAQAIKEAREMDRVSARKLFDSLDEAEEYFYSLAGEPTRRLGLEFGVNAYAVPTSNGIKYKIVGFNSSTNFDSYGYGDTVSVGFDVDPLFRAYFHTHPENSAPGFSVSDYYVAIENKVDAYVRMTNGVRFTFSYQKYLDAGKPGHHYVYKNQGEFYK